MDSDELLSGEQTPTRGSSSASRKDDVKEDIADDESFVTMEEIKGDEGHTGTRKEDPEFYFKLGYDQTMSNDIRSKRPSKVILMDYYGEGEEGANTEDTKIVAKSQRSSLRRLSRHFSRELVRRRSSIVETLPETPAGWTVLLSGLASAVLGYELHLQQSLSCPPWVFAQCGPKFDQSLPLQALFQKLTETSESLLSRPIKPSLFIGSRAPLSSTAAYLLLGPKETEHHLTFRQVLTMSTDGARIALEWELPPQETTSREILLTDAQRKKQVLSKGGIQEPVVLIMTGMNNHAKFGYIKALQRTFTDRGWIAVGMNFRG